MPWTDETVPRDKKVCFWCKWLDHSGPDCRRHAPSPISRDVAALTELLLLEREDENVKLTGFYWPSVTPHEDWCGEFEEGDAEKATARKPQKRDKGLELRIWHEPTRKERIAAGDIPSPRKERMEQEHE